VLEAIPASAPAEQAPRTPAAKRDRSTLYAKAPAANGVITLLVTSNPKRANKKSAPRFDLYRNGMTVAEHTAAYEKAGFAKSLANADRRWDLAHKFIEVSVPSAS
jgi:hypothetical protein